MEPKTGIPRRQTAILERDTGDAVVVMTETGDVLHTLQGTALFIWRQIDGSISTKMILSRLMEEYTVEEDRACVDMELFLDSLVASGLISIEYKQHR